MTKKEDLQPEATVGHPGPPADHMPNRVDDVTGVQEGPYQARHSADRSVQPVERVEHKRENQAYVPDRKEKLDRYHERQLAGIRTLVSISRLTSQETSPVDNGAEECANKSLADVRSLLVIPASSSATTGAFIALPSSDNNQRFRIAAIFKDPAIRGAIALMLSASAAGVLAFVFWAYTDRHHSAAVVGSISAEISSITFLAGVGSLNLINIFARFLPIAGWKARRFVVVSYGAASVAGLLAATIFLLTPFAKGLVIPGTAGMLAFTICVVLNSIFNIQDGGLIGFGRFAWVPVENVSVALLRLGLLPATAMFLSTDASVLVSWALPMVAAVVAVNLYSIGILAARKKKEQPSLPKFGELGRLVGIGSVTNTVNVAVSSFLPALVTLRLGSSEGGYFYVPWTITTMVALLLNNVTTSMVREVVANPEKSKNAIRRSVTLVSIMAILVMTVCLLLPQFILAPLGTKYIVHGTELLHWVGLAIPATAVIVLFWSVCLVHKRPWPSFAVNLVSSIAVVGGVMTLRAGSDISRVGVVYCSVQWAAALVVSVPTFLALRAMARDEESS